MMGTASTSESSVNFYQTIRRYNPEDSHLHTRRRENLKSYLIPTHYRLPRQRTLNIADKIDFTVKSCMLPSVRPHALYRQMKGLKELFLNNSNTLPTPTREYGLN
jgi:hypothetical protein